MTTADNLAANLLLQEVTLGAVQGQVALAKAKHREHAPANPAMSNERRLVILVEEVGEVAHALTYDQPDDVNHLVKELLQVAAVALMWVEAVDGS
jgi:NTP pyrophosphatase (non-canonical NTP hydrolase)